MKNKTKKPTRADMMEALIDDDCNSIENGCIDYLCDILRDGFKGYRLYTLKELKQEYNLRFEI